MYSMTWTLGPKIGKEPLVARLRNSLRAWEFGFPLDRWNLVTPLVTKGRVGTVGELYGRVILRNSPVNSSGVPSLVSLKFPGGFRQGEFPLGERKNKERNWRIREFLLL